MIQYAKRCVGRVRYHISQLTHPEARRCVSQVFVNSSELLVFSNEVVGRSIRFGGAYEARETQWLKNSVGGNWICFDIGANVGYYTMLFASLSRNGEVHAFEPGELNWRLLTTSLALNQYEHVRVNLSAVSDVEDFVQFERATDGAYSSMRSTGRKPTDAVEVVRSVRIDDYVVQNGISRIDLMKVDVEGAEELVIGGSSATLASEDLAPSWLFIELYDENLAAFGTSVDSVFARLLTYGYQPFVLSRGGRLIPIRSPSDAPSVYNFLFRHPRIRG